MQWQLLLHLVDRLPERLPTRVPHRLHVPRARQFEVFELHVGDAMDLLHRAIDAALGQAGEADLAVRIVAAEILQPIVVDARLILRTGMFDDIFATIADVLRLSSVLIRMSGQIVPLHRTQPLWAPLSGTNLLKQFLICTHGT